MNITNKINKKFGTKLEPKTNKEVYRDLNKKGLPSLSKLLKMIN